MLKKIAEASPRPPRFRHHRSDKPRRVYDLDEVPGELPQGR
jgi:hypothetical protein